MPDNYGCRDLRLAHNKIDKRVRNFEEDRWRDMGAVFITFTVYPALDGVLVVDR